MVVTPIGVGIINEAGEAVQSGQVDQIESKRDRVNEGRHLPVRL